MKLISPRQKRLVGLIALVGFGAVAQLVQSDRAPLYGIGTDDEASNSLEPVLLAGAMRERSAPILAPEDGFNAFEAKNPPPAELLALADWPLDLRHPPRTVAQVDANEVAAHADETPALQGGDRLAADAESPETAAANTGRQVSAAPQPSGEEKGKLEQLSPVTINPIASSAFPTVIEKDGQVAKAQSGERMVDALIAAFDTSGRDKPPAVEAGQDRAVSRNEPADRAQSAAASGGQPAASRDQAQNATESGGGLSNEMGRVGSAVSEGIKQVVSKSRDLVGEVGAFLGIGGGDKTQKAAAAPAKQAEPAHEEIPPVPNDRRANALANGPTKAPVLGQERMLLSAASLDDMRGGFSTDSGMKVFFGIERAVYINGNLVTTTALNVPDLASYVGKGVGSPQIEAINLNGITLVRNGAGNTFETSKLSASGLGTIIQNRLDGQSIRTETTINLATNSMQMLQNIEFVRSFRPN
jgi:hypothetical protein